MKIDIGGEELVVRKKHEFKCADCGDTVIIYMACKCKTKPKRPAKA